MNNDKHTDGGMNASNGYHKSGEYVGLAQWLQEVLQLSEQEEHFSNGEYKDAQLKLVVEKEYHLTFYQQIPNFVMVLLENNSSATIQYASLLFHMVGCRTCHNTYLDFYSSLHATVSSRPQSPVPCSNP